MQRRPGCKHWCCRSRCNAFCCALQARWRSELRERELDRMAQLEGEIRRREAARTAEVAALRSMLAAQQQQIMALQAQVHEQGGSAQGEAQGLGCRVDAVVLVPCRGPCLLPSSSSTSPPCRSRERDKATSSCVAAVCGSSCCGPDRITAGCPLRFLAASQQQQVMALQEQGQGCRVRVGCCCA